MIKGCAFETPSDESRALAAPGKRGALSRWFGDAPGRLAGTALGLALGAAVVAGCSSGPPKPATVDGTIQAVSTLNPSVSQRPSPLLVRLYELRSPTAFNQADFMSLYQSDQAALGADLVAREEIMLQPGEQRPIKRTLGAETRFIGVIGAYRNLEKATWRAVVPIQAGKANKLSVRADSLALTAQVVP